MGSYRDPPPMARQLRLAFVARCPATGARARSPITARLWASYRLIRGAVSPLTPPREVAQRSASLARYRVSAEPPAASARTSRRMIQVFAPQSGRAQVQDRMTSRVDIAITVNRRLYR